MKIINGLDRLRDWCKTQGLIYVQWYPCRRCSGFCIVNPSEKALEYFYENVRASDPQHESFVLILGQTETYENLNMKTLDEYIKEMILPKLL